MLSKKTYSATRWTATSTLGRAGFQFLQLVVLTRYLTPEEYGLMTIAAVVMSYVGIFSEIGVGAGFIQRQNISEAERSSLYWLSVLVGAILMATVILASPLVAAFYKEPKITFVLILVSSNFLTIALSQQLRLDAEKRLEFKSVAIIEIAAAFFGFLAALLGALQGIGVYALVAASICASWITTALSWVILSRGWRPQFRLSWDDVQWFVNFGGGMVVNNLINHVNTTVDLVLGGRLVGPSQLGLYSVPRNLILQSQLIINPIFTRIGFPLISSIQHDKSKVGRVYLDILSMTSFLNSPVYIFIALFASPIVAVLLGAKFQGSAHLLQILSIWGLCRSFINPVGSLLFGLGKVRLSLWWNAGVLLIIPPVLYFSSYYGINGIAWAMSFVMLLLIVPCWVILVGPTCGVRLVPYLVSFGRPVMCAVIAAVPTWVVVQYMLYGKHQLMFGIPLYFCAYLLASLFLNRKSVMDLFQTIGFGLRVS